MATTGYGTRTPAQTAWLVGAAGIVLLLLVGGGWLVVRGLGGPVPDRAPVAAAEPPVAATGHTPPGPEMIDGVPWGHPLDADGALAAAATAVAVTGQPDAVFDPERFAEVAEVVFTPAAAEAQAREVAAARTDLELSSWGQQPPSRRMYHFTPLALRLVAFDPERPAATVEVWSMTLVGVGDAGGAVFTTSTVDLVADDSGDTWKVTALDSVEGPTPLVDGVASPPGQTRALLRESVATMPVPVNRP